MSDFRKDLNAAYKKKVEGLTIAVAVKTALDIDAELVKITPVDTGRARSNWLPSVNLPASGTVEPNQKPHAQPVFTGVKFDDTMYITNNLPYIERLNNGWSQQQATPGWVEGAVAKYKARMKKAIKQVASGL